MKVSVITKTGKQAEITLTESNNRMSSVQLVIVDGKEIKGDWRLEGKLVKNYTNKIAIELKEENLSQISAENLKIAKVSYSNRYLSLVSNDEGYFAVKEAMKNTCSSLSEVEQILDEKEMLVSELILKLESKLQDYDVIETVETVVEFVAKNYDEEQDGNFERKEYKKVKKTLVKKVAKTEVKEEVSKKIVKTIHGTDYEFISDVDALYEMKRDCLVRKDEDDIFYCFKNGTIKRLSMMDGGFACSKKEFMSFDIIEYHNIETTVVYLKNMTIEEYIEEYIGEEIGVEEIGTENEIKEEIKENNEQKEVAYFNKQNNWYIINGNFRDEERIEEDEINLDDYQIVEIESDIFEEIEEIENKEIGSGYFDFYTYSAKTGKVILEDRSGCFHFFDNVESLKNYLVDKYSY